MGLSKKVILLFLKGFTMGMADSVPGVSGGTIALITGIYEELLNSIKSVNIKALSVLYKEGVAAAWQHINGSFLLTLGLGIISAIILVANTMVFLLAQYPQFVLCFFIGLIIASCLYIGSQIEQWKPALVGLFIAGLLLAVGLAFIPPVVGNINYAYLFFSGALAICAMILPGISGAFILLLLGVYEPVLTALRDLDVVRILVFVAGCGTGLIAFSNLLSFFFSHYKNKTLAFLLGILTGSLYSLWPWQIESTVEPGKIQHLYPTQYSLVSGVDVPMLSCIALIVFGFVLVYGLEKVVGTENSD